MDRGAQIGKVATQTGLSIDTIRFYEREGLSPEPHRSEGGYRLYHQPEIEQLQFIRKAQELGFSLQEIRELLIISNEQIEACNHVHDLIEHKLSTVRGKLKELARLERHLKAALAKCTETLSHSADQQHERCPVIEQINRNKSEVKR